MNIVWHLYRMLVIDESSTSCWLIIHTNKWWLQDALAIAHRTIARASCNRRHQLDDECQRSLNTHHLLASGMKATQCSMKNIEWQHHLNDRVIDHSLINWHALFNRKANDVRYASISTSFACLYTNHDLLVMIISYQPTWSWPQLVMSNCEALKLSSKY